MRTLHPFPNYVVTAMCLRESDLRDQLTAARYVQNRLQNGDDGSGTLGHPDVQRWTDHIESLMVYGDCCIRELTRRGLSTSYPLMVSHVIPYMIQIASPVWLLDVVETDREILYERDNEHYKNWR